MEGPRRRWKFGPTGVEEDAPPPARPEDAPSFDSARIEREAEAHFTPGPDQTVPEQAPTRKEAPSAGKTADRTREATCREDAILRPEVQGTDVQ